MSSRSMPSKWLFGIMKPKRRNCSPQMLSRAPSAFSAPNNSFFSFSPNATTVFFRQTNGHIAWRVCAAGDVASSPRCSTLQAVAEIEKQVGRLVHKRFLADLPCERLNHLPRYLKTAQELRIPMPVSVKRLQKRWEGMGR